MSDTCDDTSRTATPEAPASRRTQNEHYLSDYVGIRIDPDGRLYKSFSCPRPDTMCDGCTLFSVADCLRHECEHHKGPYTCFICGQKFAVATALRRHPHYNDSEEKREAIQAADAIKKSVASVRGDGSTVSAVRVYHGNAEARHRAARLLKLVKKEEFEEGRRRKKDRRVAAKRSNKRVSTRDSFVVGTIEETVVGMAGAVLKDEMSETEAWSCKEPCCPFYERHFPSKGAHARHLSSHAHQVSMRMGEALLVQLRNIVHHSQTVQARTATIPSNNNEADSARVKQSSPSSTDVEMSDYIADLGINRANTPPPHPIHAHTSLLSPPATPSSVTVPHTQPQLRQSSSHSEDALPKALAERLAATRHVLRELQCNAPGCTMYRKKMAGSQAYWSHLASSPHMTALKEWNAEGGDAVYVQV
ncbi:hypothetical protein NQ176_g6638 [Zarea fungicola]|uniref:Uncharacterized protein n=1 Tax=Zarea fungicola TaxID=93591 RepID=A0ACC1N296_9HYPO|nr:hypothetical protein NQ176_g6638 [Lecanicillium fungicola]